MRRRNGEHRPRSPGDETGKPGPVQDRQDIRDGGQGAVMSEALRTQRTLRKVNVQAQGLLHDQQTVGHAA